MTAEEAPEEMNFERAFARLEEILSRMNAGGISLDESLKLYEEADTLVASCNQRLTEAEERVEMLIKKRNGELQVGPSGHVQTADFASVGRATRPAVDDE